MNKKTLVILGVAAVAGAYLLMSMRKKSRGYSIDVPAPEKITEEEFNQPAARQSFLQKAAPIVQSIFRSNPTRKAARQQRRATRRAARKVGELPVIY